MSDLICAVVIGYCAEIAAKWVKINENDKSVNENRTKLELKKC